MTRTNVSGRTFGSAAVVVALLVSGACGGTDSGRGVASAEGEPNPAGEASPAEAEDTEQLDPEAQALVFAECMRDNDVDMPDPGPGQEGMADAFQEMARDYDQDTVEQAFAACEDLLPQYASEQQHDDEVILDLAECLREQGLDVSDNPFDDAHSGNVDVNEFSAAMEVCRDVLVGGSS